MTLDDVVTAELSIRLRSWAGVWVRGGVENRREAMDHLAAILNKAHRAGILFRGNCNEKRHVSSNHDLEAQHQSPDDDEVRQDLRT